MRRYFFHTLSDGVSEQDAEGRCFASEAEAEAEALRGVGSILADEIAAGRRRASLTVLVDDEAGKRLLEVLANVDVDVRKGGEGVAAIAQAGS